MSQIEKNKADLWKDIQGLAEMPLNAARGANLVKNLEVYEALCRIACAKGNNGVFAIAEASEATHLDRQTAEMWMSKMKNADDTLGPHFSRVKAQEIAKQYNVDCDSLEFWVALNATYSDMCEFFKRHDINTMGAYVDHTLTFWFRDRDAVDEKLAAYYAYVVKH